MCVLVVFVSLGKSQWRSETAPASREHRHIDMVVRWIFNTILFSRCGTYKRITKCYSATHYNNVNNPTSNTNNEIQFITDVDNLV